jgi:hypothetical protein
MWPVKGFLQISQGTLYSAVIYGEHVRDVNLIRLCSTWKKRELDKDYSCEILWKCVHGLSVMWFPQNSHIAPYQYRGASERIDFNQILLNTYYHLCNGHKIGAILKYQLFINKMFYRKVHFCAWNIYFFKSPLLVLSYHGYDNHFKDLHISMDLSVEHFVNK